MSNSFNCERILNYPKIIRKEREREILEINNLYSLFLSRKSVAINF